MSLSSWIHIEKFESEEKRKDDDDFSRWTEEKSVTSLRVFSKTCSYWRKSVWHCFNASSIWWSTRDNKSQLIDEIEGNLIITVSSSRSSLCQLNIDEKRFSFGDKYGTEPSYRWCSSLDKISWLVWMGSNWTGSCVRMPNNCFKEVNGVGGVSELIVRRELWGIKFGDDSVDISLFDECWMRWIRENCSNDQLRRFDRSSLEMVKCIRFNEWSRDGSSDNKRM